MQRCHFVGGQKVVADQDVAKIYGVSTGQLRRRVKRHIDRFPPDFLIKANDGYYFTEAGILMVSSIVKNTQADEVSLGIVRELFGFQSN